MNMKKTIDKCAFFTMDVESFTDTECVRKYKYPIGQSMLDGLDKYIEILDKHDIKATLFVLSDLAPEIQDRLSKFISNGHKIALHGKNHTPAIFLTNEQFKEQITHAKNKIEKMLDVCVTGYRAPCFSLDRDKLDILQSMGFSYDSSKMDFSFAMHNGQMNIDDFEKEGSGVYKKGNFYEFGVSVQKLFFEKYPVSGGGYIRVGNWLFSRILLNRYLKNNDRYMFYSHPFEFSEEKIPMLKKFNIFERYYLLVGRASYLRKVEYIIKKLKKHGYKFCTFEDVCEKAVEKQYAAS